MCGTQGEADQMMHWALPFSEARVCSDHVMDVQFSYQVFRMFSVSWDTGDLALSTQNLPFSAV